VLSSTESEYLFVAGSMTTEQNTDSTFNNLKAAREKSGLTLKEMFARTRISVVNLEAIENGDFHLLPVPIYTRNFIRTYAEALGADPGPSLQEYESYLQAQKIKENAQKEELPPETPLATAVNRHKASLWVLCIIVVFAAVSFFVSKYNKHSQDVLEKSEVRSTAAVAPSPGQPPAQPGSLSAVLDPLKPENLVAVPPAGQAEKMPEQKKVQAQTEDDSNGSEALAEDEEPSTLTIQATEETWIRIKADNKEPFQVVLKEGDKISQKAARFTIDVGNAGGIRMQFNGKKIENLGKSGQVIHLRLPQN
jgi:cytoskeleton protein RodZ